MVTPLASVTSTVTDPEPAAEGVQVRVGESADEQPLGRPVQVYV